MDQLEEVQERWDPFLCTSTRAANEFRGQSGATNLNQFIDIPQFTTHVISLDVLYRYNLIESYSHGG